VRPKHAIRPSFLIDKKRDKPTTEIMEEYSLDNATIFGYQ